MASEQPLLNRSAIEAIAKRAKPRWKKDPKKLLGDVQGRVVSERRATSLLEHPVPYFFETWEVERGKESAKGKVLHGYDDRKRLVLVEQPGELTIDFTLIEYTKDATYRTRVSKSRRGRDLDIEHVWIGGTSDAAAYDVSVDIIEKIAASLWPSGSQPPFVQHWELAKEAPTTSYLQYEVGGSLAQIERNGVLVWPKKQLPKGKADVDASAEQLLALVRKRRPRTKEPILLLTVTIEADDLAAVPPSLGVVFRRDAEAFVRNPKIAGEDGVDALLSPTLQEDYDFPCRAKYPFISIAKTDAPAFDVWKDSDVLRSMPKVVDAMNRGRCADEPPFLLVDIEGDARSYVSRLSKQDRALLAPFKILPVK